MFTGWTMEELLEYQDNLKLTDRLRELLQTGTIAEAAACGKSTATVSRLLARRNRAEDGDLRALLAGKSTGRTPQCAPTADDLRVLRAVYLKTNRAENTGSKRMAARLLARSGELSDDVSAAILKPRATKALPKCLRDAMHVAPALFQHHRSPKEAALDGFYIPGALRMVRDADGLRRLHPGERQSWDDATINFGVVVPWPWGGDPCADRFGVKLGRFQLLTCVDDASDFCPGYSYVIREQQSYRAEDTVAAQFRLCRDQYAPNKFMLEGGAWQSKRAKDFYQAAGIGVEDATGRPHLKLIESWFNRLWTVLSMRAGQVGRYRGEMERENKQYLAARQGRLDPREHFPALEDALRDIDFAIAYLNAEQVESKKYGRWVPQKLHADGLAAFPRPRLDRGLFYHAAPIVERRLVRRNMVGVTCPSPFGGSFPYHFATDALYDFEGCYVRVYFDPFDSPLAATIVLDHEHHGLPRGHVIAHQAPCLEDAPEVMRLLAGLNVEINSNGLETAIAMRKQIHGAIRREYRALGFGGHDIAHTSEARTPRGQVARIEVSSQPSDSALTGRPAQEPAARGTSFLRARLAPDPEVTSSCPVAGQSSRQPSALSRQPSARKPIRIKSRLELLHA